MTPPRKIAVFTGTRAEYGLLRPVLSRLREQEGCQLQLIVSGTHLSDKHGNTIDEIIQDGFAPAATIPIDLANDTPVHLCMELGKLVSQIGSVFEKLAPDILVLLGDRYECLGAALAASMVHLPIAHIHGGEVTYGAMDDGFRHAITKLSHLHFTSCEVYRQRVIQMGEQPDRVFNVGSLGVENALSIKPIPENQIRKYLDLPEDSPYFLVTFHPVTLEPGQELAQINALTTALDAFPVHKVIFTGVNADPGANIIAEQIANYKIRQPERVRLFDSLGVIRYLSAARYAACVVGNSSSGIIEIPSLKVPVVNIGNRQQGRVHADSVINCATDAGEIVAAMTKAISPEGKALALSTINPYSYVNDKEPSNCISNILSLVSLTKLTEKEFYNK